MDPRFKQVLLMLLQLMVEQDQPRPDPMDQPAPDKEQGAHPTNSLGHDLEQLIPVKHHYVWPFSPQVTNFGGP